jgi:hypothetical protein
VSRKHDPAHARAQVDELPLRHVLPFDFRVGLDPAHASGPCPVLAPMQARVAYACMRWAKRERSH